MWSLLKLFWEKSKMRWYNPTTEDTVSSWRVRQLHPCYPLGRWWCCQGRDWYSVLSLQRSTVLGQWSNDGPPACLYPCCRAAHSTQDSLDHRWGHHHTRPPHHLQDGVNIFMTVLKVLTKVKRIPYHDSWSWFDIFLVWHWDSVLSSLSLR